MFCKRNRKHFLSVSIELKEQSGKFWRIRSPNFHSCFYNAIATRYMFSTELLNDNKTYLTYQKITNCVCLEIKENTGTWNRNYGTRRVMKLWNIQEEILRQKPGNIMSNGAMNINVVSDISDAGYASHC